MSDTAENTPNYISLADVYLSVSKGLNILWRNSLWIMIIASIGSSSLFLYSFLQKPIYKTKITFFVEEQDKVNGMFASYMNVASQLGLASGSSKAGAVSDENVMEMLKSSRVIETALFNKVQISNNRNDLLINYYIDKLELREEWSNAKNKELKNVTFKELQRTNNTILQDSVIQLFVKDIKEDLAIEKATKQSNLISVEFRSPDQLLTKLMLENIVDAVGKIYTQRKTQRAKETVDFIQSRADSIKRELYGSEYGLAKFSDANNRLIKAEGSLSEGRLMRNVQMLGIAYAKIVENLEMSKVSLLNQTPLVQVVDAPFLPVPREKKLGKLMGILLGGFMGAFLASLYFLVRAKILEELP